LKTAVNTTIGSLKLSVILPSYNCADSIGKAIESVLLQDFQDKELIIIDGKSTDDTVDVIRGYAQKHPCVRWVSELDKGVYDAMNKGVAMSSGEWVYFLGADDMFYDSGVISCVLSSVSAECQVIYGNVLSARFQGKYDGKFYPEKMLRQNICHQAIFYRKDLFERFGGYSLRYKVLADYEFNLRWMLNPSVAHKYVDIIIAFYGSEGVSSIGPADAIFSADFFQLILRYGKGMLSGRAIRECLFRTCNSRLDQGDLWGSMALLLRNIFLLRFRSGYYVLVYFKRWLRLALRVVRPGSI
jgi:glycosyltransferase involved in cell wall biosynthesis